MFLKCLSMGSQQKAGSRIMLGRRSPASVFTVLYLSRSTQNSHFSLSIQKSSHPLRFCFKFLQIKATITFFLASIFLESNLFLPNPFNSIPNTKKSFRNPPSRSEDADQTHSWKEGEQFFIALEGITKRRRGRIDSSASWVPRTKPSLLW